MPSSSGPLYYTNEDVDTLVNNNDDGAGNAPPRQAGDRMAASYINFYLGNHAVIVPQFGDPRVRPLSSGLGWPPRLGWG